MKPRVYIDKDGDVTVVFAKDSERQNVTVVHDRGQASKGTKNVFGFTQYRYIFHCANAYGDSGHSSSTDKFSTPFGTEYKLIKKVAPK